MTHQTYKLSIVYILIFSLLLMASGALLFEHKIGFSVESIIAYYLGDEEKFIPLKSASGVLKLALPHIFVFGLFLMVILHFLVFTKQRKKKATRTLIYLIFTSALLEIFSPFVILFGLEFFAYVKIASFLALEVLTLYVLWLLFYSVVYD